MGIVDYIAVGDRFLDGQRHLTDNIHPTAAISLEVANLYFNLILQARRAAVAALDGAGT